MNVVAIHQPNFFPWLGYFDKIVRSDSFVFLDDVQIQKTGGGWSNRVRMLIAGAPRWVTAPIDRNYHGGRKICETRFVSNSSWRTSIFRMIQVHYKNAPYYGYGSELIEPLLMNPEENLAAYNTSAILSIADELGICRSKFRWSSKLDHSGQANELLVSIVENVGGNAYMCGGGADGYQEQSFFDSASIHLINQNYKTADYPQYGCSVFVPGLSVIDAFMNLGGEGTRQLLLNSSPSHNGL